MFFIILASALAVFMVALLIIPATQGLSPFKLISGDLSDYNFIEESKFRGTNILEGLLGITDPYVYEMSPNEPDSFEYLDEKEKRPFFKEFNDYDVLIEAYNKPQWSSSCLEIYGPYGIEFICASAELKTAEQELLSSIQSANPNTILVPYYAAIYDGVTYISAIDLSSSILALERFDGKEYTTVATVSGDTWKEIAEKNGGIAVLRNSDGTLVFGGGSYRFTILLKQVLIDNEGGKASLKTRSPKTVVYDLSVNDHECANGVLIANNAVENMDVQLNFINDDSAVCYAPESKIYMGNTFNLGVSLSEERYRKLLGSPSAQAKLEVTVEVYRYDNESDTYIIVESKEIMDPYSMFFNKTFVFDGAEYQTGRYKIIMKYESKREHIEQEYEYYLVFEG